MGSVGESLEYEDIQTETKLDDCASVEMRNREVGMKYVKGGEVGWTPEVRRKKSARNEDGDDSDNSNINLNLIKRNLVRYREVNGIPGIKIRGSLRASRWV